MNEEQCDDHHICRNGSICVSHASGNFYCDCAAAPAGAIYAGISCDHLATSFCNAQGFESITSFCTNGGACKEMVNDIASEEHAGCNCPDDYKGNVRMALLCPCCASPWLDEVDLLLTLVMLLPGPRSSSLYICYAVL
jgi:hypothetical protein